MAKREMPKPMIPISDHRDSDITRTEATMVNDNIDRMLNQPTEIEHTMVGIVVNCKKLNLRTRPSKASTVIYEIPADSKLTVNLDRSINGWFSVRTESGLEGFCMKDYISIT